MFNLNISTINDISAITNPTTHQIVIQRERTACSWRNSNSVAKTHQALIDEPKRKLAKSE